MVSVIAVTMRSQFMYNLLFNYVRQEWKDKELIVILNKDDMNIEVWKEQARLLDRVSIYQLPEKYTLGKCLNWAIAHSKSKVIAKFDDDDYYSPHYLTEGMLTIKKTNYPIVGKHTSYIYFEEKRELTIFREGKEHMDQKKLKGGTLIFKRFVWDRVKFNESKVAGSDARWLSDCARAGIRAYSISKENYVCVRRKNVKSHTQRRSLKRYLSRCKHVCFTRNYSPYCNECDFKEDSEARKEK